MGGASQKALSSVLSVSLDRGPADSSPIRQSSHSGWEASGNQRYPFSKPVRTQQPSHPVPRTLTWPQPGGQAISTQGSRAGGVLSVEQSPVVTGASRPSAPCTHVTFRAARSAPQADEHTSDTSHLRTAQDSHQALPCLCHQALNAV